MIPKHELDEVTRLRRARDFGAALAKATELVGRFPSAAEAWLKRGYVHALMKQHREAIEDATKAIELEPEEPDPRFTRARWLLDAGRFDEAIQDLRAVLALEEKHNDDYYVCASHLLLASGALELGRLDEARDACARVPDDLPVWSRGGLLRKSDLEKRLGPVNGSKGPDRGTVTT